MTEHDLQLHEALATHLEDSADDLTDVWLAELRQRLRVREVRLLPTEELRDHVPFVIRSLASYLRVAGYSPADEVTSYLRLISELRREQSYPVVEVLREFQLLSEIVCEAVLTWLEQDGEWSLVAVGRMIQALHHGLGGIGIVAVEAYQEAFLREKQRLADRLSDLASTLEHEIRTPLQAASSSADLLRDDEIAQDPVRRERYADLIQERLRRIGHLTAEIRELAVAERALTRVDRRPIREVIRDVVHEVQASGQAADVRIEVVEPLAEIRVDPGRVEVALMNLVSNAVKYSDPQKPDRWVRISLTTIDSEESPRWKLRVEDNGLGIPPNLLYQVFQRRVRVHPNIAEGTGLGLAIVKEVMEQRGGAVFVESELGKGSAFTLELTPRLVEGVRADVDDEAARDRPGEATDAPGEPRGGEI